MKKILKTIVSFLLATVIVLPLGACDGYKDTALPHFDYADGDGKSYNTELFYINDFDVSLGDPTVIYTEEEGGELWFYVTGTVSGRDFDLYKTKNFTDWIDLGVVYDPPENFFGVNGFYAPQIIFDEEADWEYYLGADAGEGKGLYIMFFSARITEERGPCQLSVAFSKNVEGPYVNFEGYNANGDYVDASNTNFDIEKLKGLGLGENTKYGPLYKENRSFIDACPFVDPLTGDKYLLMCRNYVNDTTSDVWGVKMKDWVSPYYETTTPLTSHGYLTTEKEELFEYTPMGKIDEGPFMYYKDPTDDGIDNGTYYLTLSIGDTNDKFYPVCMAIGDSPLGPFTKIQPSDDGFMNCPKFDMDVHSSGHHAFFELDGDLFIAYHTYQTYGGGNIKSRYFAFDKVEWTYNAKGQYIMHTNGPTNTIQPLPKAISGYENVARLAKVSTTKNQNDATLLNDGLIAQEIDDCVKEFSVNGDVEITLSFDEYVTARAILVYNSCDYDTIFESVEKIEFWYEDEKDGKKNTGIAYIKDLGFNLDHYLVPKMYLGFFEDDVLPEEEKVIRNCGAAIAEFDEIKVNKVKIKIKKGNSKAALNISDIVILGKSA